MREEIVTYYCDYCKKPVAENQLIWDSCNVNNMLEFCPECLDTHKQSVMDEYFIFEGELMSLNQIYEIAWEGYKKMFIHKSK